MLLRTSVTVQYNAFVFSADEWMLSLYGTDFPVERFQDHGDVVKQVLSSQTVVDAIVSAAW